MVAKGYKNKSSAYKSATNKVKKEKYTVKKLAVVYKDGKRILCRPGETVDKQLLVDN